MPVWLDRIIGVAPGAYVAFGWMREGETAIEHLRIVAPTGEAVDLPPAPVRIVREDVSSHFGEALDDSPPHGFVAFLRLEAPCAARTGWRLEVRAAGADHVSTNSEFVSPATGPTRRALLELLQYRTSDAERLLAEVIEPAFSSAQAYQQEHVRVASQAAFGAPPADLAVSLVVPLYGRIDFVEYQLAQFARDPELQRDAELIYVLDSPELAPKLLELAPFLHETYRVPFRVLCLDRNAGYATATNVGARQARGRLLLLLNSDIVPARPGWLRPLVTAYEGDPAVGALGPKLLYEDGTLQHAGMWFELDASSRCWRNRHYYKGLDGDFPPANQPREVPAVTGACLLVSRAKYAAVGGLCGGYVQGDFEDSDLCLRLLEAGWRNRYFPGVELYHLEGQSYPNALRAAVYRYNVWLHTRMWDERLRDVASRQPPAFPG